MSLIDYQRLNRPIAIAVGDDSSAHGRLLHFTNATFWFGERPLVGESRHSSKEFICSVRPSLNDRFRLGAAGQIIELRQAENDPFQPFGSLVSDVRFREDSLKLSSQGGWNKASLAHHFGLPKGISIR